MNKTSRVMKISKISMGKLNYLLLQEVALSLTRKTETSHLYCAITLAQNSSKAQIESLSHR